MEEKKFVKFKKEEFKMKEFIKENLGKGRISHVSIEYTPVGEKLIVETNKPGYIIGKQGGRIAELTELLKRKFKLENPHIEIAEINNPDFDSRTVADDIALSLERFGNLRFKAIAYRSLQRIMRAGALGAEISISGKLPGERAKTWRFAQGYLKKTGDTARMVSRSQARAITKTGMIGIKVSILPKGIKLLDRVDMSDELKNKIKSQALLMEEKNGSNKE